MDVHSFAMVCFKILPNEDPFYNANIPSEILKRIKKSERPKLPSNCDELTKLVEECWRWNP